MKISQLDEGKLDGVLDIFKKDTAAGEKGAVSTATKTDVLRGKPNYAAGGGNNPPVNPPINNVAPYNYQNQGPKAAPGAADKNVKVTQTTKPAEKEISTKNERVPPQIKAQMDAEKAAAEKAAAKAAEKDAAAAEKGEKKPTSTKAKLATGAAIIGGAALLNKDSSDTTKGGTDADPNAPKGDGTIKDPSPNSPFHPRNTGGVTTQTGSEVDKEIADLRKANPTSSGYKGSAGSQAIQALNPEIADVNKIRTGQELKMPDGSTYTVKKGDALDRIARNAGVNRPSVLPSNTTSDLVDRTRKNVDSMDNRSAIPAEPKVYKGEPASVDTRDGTGDNDKEAPPERDYSTGRPVDKELDDKYGTSNKRTDADGRTYVRVKDPMYGPDREQRSFDSLGSWFNALRGKGDVNGKVADEVNENTELNTIKKLSSITESQITQVDNNMDFRKLLAIMSETKMADLKGTKHSGKYGTEHDTDEEGEEKKRGGQESDATKDSKKWQGAADAAKLVSGGKSKKVDETKMADLKGTKHTGKYGNSYNTDEEGEEKKHTAKKKTGTPQVPALKGMSPLGLKSSLKDWIEHTEAALLEGAKPDFLDMDKDGDKKEPMKKAAKEMKKEVDEGKADPTGSWVVYDGSKVKRFKSRDGAKAYAEKNGGKVASSEHYHDNIQKQSVKEGIGDGGNIIDMLNLADNKQQQGNTREAIALLTHVLKTGNKNIAHYIKQAIAELKSGQTDEYEVHSLINDAIDELDLDESLKGGQKKLDKNHNSKLDSQDFKMLRKSKVDEEEDYTSNGKKISKDEYLRIQGAMALSKSKAAGKKKVEEGVNLHKMMTEKHTKVDEMLEELQREIAEFKTTGEMGDKLRDALDLHTYTKGETLIGEETDSIGDEIRHGQDVQRDKEMASSDARHMQDMDRAHDDSTADLWRMKDLARDKSMGRADQISLREDDHKEGDTVYHRGQIGIVDRIEGDKCFVHKPNGDMDVWPTDECSKKKQGAFDIFKKDVQDVGSGFGRFLKGKSELDESPFTFESKKAKVEEEDAQATDQPKLKTKMTDTGTETTSSTGRIKATFEPGKETKVEPVKESFVYDVWNHQLEKMISESTVKESLTVTTTKGDNGTDDSVSVTASGNDASDIMAILRNAGIGGMGGEEEHHAEHPTSAYGAPEGDSVGVIKIDGPEVIDGGDTMLNLMKKIAGINSGHSEHDSSEDYADENDDCDYEEVDEGNAFTGALKDTPKGGKFEVDGKEYTDNSSLEEGHGMCSECGNNMSEGDCGHKQMVDEDDVEDAKVGIAAGSPAVQAAEPAAGQRPGGIAFNQDAPATTPDAPANPGTGAGGVAFNQGAGSQTAAMPTSQSTAASAPAASTSNIRSRTPDEIANTGPMGIQKPSAEQRAAGDKTLNSIKNFFGGGKPDQAAQDKAGSAVGAGYAQAQAATDKNVQAQNTDVKATAQRDQLQKDMDAGKSVASTNIAPSQINPAVLGQQAGATTKATGKVSYAPNAGGVTKTASAAPKKPAATQTAAAPAASSPAAPSKMANAASVMRKGQMAEADDEFAEVGLEEDAEYANSNDDAALQDIKFMTNFISGGLNGKKTMHRHGYQNGDNPLAMRESVDPLVQWKKLSGIK